MSRASRRIALTVAALLVTYGLRSALIGSDDKTSGPNATPASAAEKPAAAANDQRTSVEKAFEKRVSAKLKNVPLKNAAAHLADLAGVNVLVASKAIADAGIQENLPIEFEMADVSFGSALRAMLAEHDLGYEIPEDNVLLITTAENAKSYSIMRVYDVLDLISQPAAPDEFADDAAGNDRSAIVDVVKSCIEPTSWNDSGGTGLIMPIGGSLAVSSNPETHLEIAQLFAALRKINSDELAGRQSVPLLIDSGPAEEKIRERLARRQDFDFHEMPLTGLVDDLRADGIPVSIDRKQLSDAGADLKVPLRFKAKQVRLEFALRSMLRPNDLNFILRDDALVITTDAAEKEHARLGVYPVSDLLDAKPGDRSTDLDFDSLIDLITSAVAPTSWPNGGGGVSPWAHPVALIIDQSEEVHEQIAELLAKLRAAHRAAKESAIAMPAADAGEAIIVRIHRVSKANGDDASLDKYIAAIRNVIEPASWQGRYIGKVPGGIVVRNTQAVQDRITRLIAQIDAQVPGGMGGGAF